MCICSLWYPACIAHAIYYIAICGLSDSTKFFSRFLINGTVSKNSTEPKMRVLIFSTMLSAVLPILIIIVRDMINMFIGFHVNYPLFLSDIYEN